MYAPAVLTDAKVIQNSQQIFRRGPMLLGSDEILTKSDHSEPVERAFSSRDEFLDRTVWPRMHAFADHLPNTKSTVNSGFFKGNADELPHLHRTTDRR
jgi:hypothetical protein